MTDIDRNMTNISLARSFDFTSLTGLGVFLRNNDLDVPGSSFEQIIADSNRTEAVYEPYVSLPMLEKSLPSAAHEQHLVSSSFGLHKSR